MWSADWQRLIVALHARQRPSVLAVTGGGASAIAELLAVPGASRTILEARVPYAATALADWLGKAPEHSCDEATGLAMASVAAFRGRQLLGSDDANLASQLLGLGCTASLASDRPKRGDHRCWIALQSPTFTASYQLTLQKDARSRAEEEIIVGQLIVRILAEGAGLTDLPPLNLLPSEQVHRDWQSADPGLQSVWSGTAGVIWSHCDGSLNAAPPKQPQGLLCGAFNPRHRGHEELRSIAERKLGGLVAYELSVTNVDKPPLDYLTIERRRRQFTDYPLALTNAPRFYQKAALFPGTTFIVGSDTAIRIVDARYYNGNADALESALQMIRAAGCRFLVASRMCDGKLLSLSDIKVSQEARDLFEEIPDSEFRVDISSTDLRKSGQSS